jgi:hypothetical protein
MVKIDVAILVLALVFGGHFASAHVEIEGVRRPVAVKVFPQAFIRTYVADFAPQELQLSPEEKTQLFYNTFPYADVDSGRLQISLWRIETVAEGERFWFGGNSSLGLRSSERLLRFVQDQVMTPTYRDCGSFARQPSAIQTLLSDTPYRYFAQAAEGYANFVAGLLAKPADDRSLDRPIYTRQCYLADFVTSNQQILFVDPTPGFSPEAYGYMIVMTTLLSE